ncbi:hypothetical protein [Pseudomonas rubra]|uniref:Phage integrase family protein n=1 Tax=Pseudomonas rubra TaxID=2942627 RepID=A0ABT5PGB4_9PSED|nr:hypothetical protein [Pseudomonas rubra]MDD1017349.1 hypothetical protein [Pseudomonas rubra]MDD1041605.1 hypothetical protein [Pseudomonas rubra]MDD1156934.1 hypothetical protein [Pseudomonas rubra]
MLDAGKLEVRATETITISDIGNGQEFLYPEKLRIQLDSRLRVSPVDFGAFAYTVRELRGADGYAVDLSTLLVGRREILRVILDYLYVSGMSETSIQIFIKTFEAVMRWCDANGHSGLFLSPDTSRDAYIQYTEHLRRQLLVTGELKPLTCINRQRAMRTLIEIVHRDDSAYIIRGVVPIKVVREGRSPPQESDVRRYLDTCIRIATQFSNFLLDGKPYPLVVKFSDYETSILPFAGAQVTPYSPGRISNTLSPDGKRVSTVQEYIEATQAYPSVANRCIDYAHRIIEAANTDLRCEHRMWLASMAINAYACIFSLITGAGASEFIQFEYDEAIDIEKSLVKKELTAVKFRARGVTTRYAIGRGHGRALLRSYLKLREWVLDGKEMEYLFFTMRKSGVYLGEYQQLANNFSTRFFQRLRGIFLPKDAKNIPPGSVRKFKSSILHELRVSVSLVADTLNHTEAVNIASYTETSVEKQQDEFSAYWQAIRKAADVVRDRISQESMSTVVGHCEEMEHPVRILETVPIEPSCTTQYGCLFCKNYLCHADDEDLHKLLSLSYVINSIRDTAKDISHAERLFRELSIRIDVIVEAVAKRSAESALLVEQVKRRVDDLGILTPFWEKRLHRYEKLGVVF